MWISLKLRGFFTQLSTHPYFTTSLTETQKEHGWNKKNILGSLGNKHIAKEKWEEDGGKKNAFEKE